jgi:ABC-type transport system involved in cytochrome c biogenesis permease component
MRQFFFLCRFLLRVEYQHIHQWWTAALFYMSSFFMVGLLLNPMDHPTFWTFYLLIQNFTAAFFLKDTFAEDLTTTRLHILLHQPLPVEIFLFAVVVVQSILVFLLQIIALPFLGLFFTPFLQKAWPNVLVWQGLSALFLSMLYLLGAAFTLKNRLGVFLSIIIVLPLLTPWFLLSFEFLRTQDMFLLGVITALLCILLPCTLLAKYWLLRSVTPLLA